MVPLSAVDTAANGIALDKIDESPADAREAGRIQGRFRTWAFDLKEALALSSGLLVQHPLPGRKRRRRKPRASITGGLSSLKIARAVTRLGLMAAARIQERLRFGNSATGSPSMHWKKRSSTASTRGIQGCQYLTPLPSRSQISLITSRLSWTEAGARICEI